jgi:hypothetical protein
MTEPRLGDQYGQILVGLSPKTPELRDVDAIIEAMRAEVTATPGPVQISFLRLAGGQPTSKPISVDARLPQDRGDLCLPRLPVTAVWWQAPIVASLIAASCKTHQAPPAFAGSALANSKRGIPCL